MNTSGIRADDIVYCDVRGDRFMALVDQPMHRDEGLKKRGLTLRPITPGARLRYHFVTSRQVVGHWRKAAGTAVPGEPVNAS